MNTPKVIIKEHPYKSIYDENRQNESAFRKNSQKFDLCFEENETPSNHSFYVIIYVYDLKLIE